MSLANTQQSCRMGEPAGEGVLSGAPASSHVIWEISWVISPNPQNLTIDGVKFRALTEINTQLSYFLFSILIPPTTISIISSPGDHFTFLCISSYATTYDANVTLWVPQPWFLKPGFLSKKPWLLQSNVSTSNTIIYTNHFLKKVLVRNALDS